MNEFVIREPKVVVEDGWCELSADIEGDRLWFKIRESEYSEIRAEPFVAMGLLEAMADNATLRVEGMPFSPSLHAKLKQIQEVYHCWNDELNLVQVMSDRQEPSIRQGTVASFYSAGVDSTHTLMRQREEITHLILIVGFDGGAEQESWHDRIEAQRSFAESIGKHLTVVRTNARHFCFQRSVSWQFAHGLLLATVGSLFGFEKVLIPSSHTYDELFPWGSHPLTDPMWSIEGVSIVHDASSHRRVEKVKDICKDQSLLDSLKVCWRSTESNCGTCSKCVRTMLAVHLLGATSANLPPFRNVAELKALKSQDEGTVTSLEELIRLAKENGEEAIYRQLSKYHKRYKMCQALPMLDYSLFNGVLKRYYHRFRRPEWLDQKVNLRAKKL